MSLNLAIVGATGAVGREILAVLEQRSVPVAKLRLFASARSAGGTITFRGTKIPIEALPEGEPKARTFAGLDAVLLSAGATISRRIIPAIVRDGVLAIDNSSAFREDPKIPLVIPELNGGRIAEALAAGGGAVIANPNCTAAVLLMALAPLHREARAKRVVVATYQAVSGKGARAMEECRKQTKDVLEGRPAVPHVFPRPIAFNLIPQVDDFAPDGRTKEEIKVENETRKILEDPSIRVDATCVRVPVLRCHSEAVNVEFERPITPERARELWRSAPGVVSMDDPAAGVYPTPLDAEGRDEIFAGRCRRSLVFERGLAFWCVGDQLRKGAALNAVQILEEALGAARPAHAAPGSRARS